MNRLKRAEHGLSLQQVTIDDEDLAQRQAKKALKTPKSGLSRTQRDRDALAYPAISPEVSVMMGWVPGIR